MSFVKQAPVLLVIIPLLSALLVNILGLVNRRYCLPVAILGILGSFAASVVTLIRVIENGAISYRLGGWPPPFGIEYVIDHLNGLVLVTVSFVSLLAVIFSKESVKQEVPEKIPQFYTLFILLVTGLLGMTVTGDAFNLYVLLEISALTGYALIAMGDNRALVGRPAHHSSRLILFKCSFYRPASHPGRNLDQDGLLSVAWLAAQCLYVCPFGSRLPGCTPGHQGVGLYHDPHYAVGFFTALCL